MKLTSLLVLFFTISFSVSAFAASESPSSFRDAKKVTGQIHDGFNSFYCGCEFSGKSVDLSSCGYEPRKQPKRAKRIEWEHVVSAWEIGHQRQCWQTGGRRNCERNDPIFNRMAGDLVNLVPASGEPNADRSNFRFGMIEGESRAYGQCDFEVSWSLRRAEPAPSVRGDIARIYFYMRDRYGVKISRQQTQLFDAWNRLDPVNQEETIRNERIQAEQGQGNCYVSGDCKIERDRTLRAVPHLSEKSEPLGSSNGGGESQKCNSEKRYCSHMNSCADARFYLNQCGRSSLDGDGDGNPCESLCR
jgi:deoxyribonuclease-1